MKSNKKWFIINFVLIFGLIISRILDLLTTYFALQYPDFFYEANPFMAPHMDNYFFIAIIRIIPIIGASISNLGLYYLSSPEFSFATKGLIVTGFLLITYNIYTFYFVLNNLSRIYFFINTNQISIF